DLLIDVIRYVFSGTDASTDLLPGAQIYIADIHVPEGVLAVDESDHLEFLSELVHHYHIAYGDALVLEGARQQDLIRPCQLCPSRSRGQKQGIGRDHEECEIDVETSIGPRVEEGETKRSSLGDTNDVFPHIGGLGVDYRSRKRRALVHTRLEGERRHR